MTRSISHTPGPWEAWDDDGTGTLPCVLAKQVTDYGNFYVAQCNVFADAQFIAAAPAMKAALLLARDTYANLTSEQFARGEDKPAREAIDAALKLAGVEVAA